MRMIDCARCGRHRPHHSKGLCSSCQTAVRRASTATTECDACGQVAIISARRMCGSCYQAWLKRGESGLAARLERMKIPPLTREVFAVEWPHMLGMLGEQRAIARLMDAYSVSESHVRQHAREFGHDFQKVAA